MMLPRDAADLLPQKDPFRMVDQLLFADEHTIKTCFRVEEGNVLLCGAHFCEGGLIENMAQSIAAGSGYISEGLQQEIAVGYIGAVKRVRILRLPLKGELLETEVHIRNRFGNASIAAATVFVKKEEIASCELTIFVQQT